MNKPAILITNYQIDLKKIVPVSIIPNQTNGDIDWINVYLFKELLKLNFLDHIINFLTLINFSGKITGKSG